MTPYSGMLPGYIAGHYTFDECHIDLVKVAKFGNFTLIHESAVSIQDGCVVTSNPLRPPIRYDALSIDIGSTPMQVRCTSRA
jgi:selenide,water dikinase